MRFFLGAMRLVGLLGLLYACIVLTVYFRVPHSNASLGTVDTLIVLGCPSLDNGDPSPEQRERVREAVREFKAGVSTHMIVTGAAAHNHWVEAVSMAHQAEVQGVPASAILVEPSARNTIQNIFYSDAIMQKNGWHTAEVISSPSHLPRTSLILQHWPDIRWKEHAARWPAEYNWVSIATHYWPEAVTTAWMVHRGLPHSKFLPN